MFFDEGRFGLKPVLGRGWYLRGVRPVQAVRPRYQNFYLYSAVNPMTGEELSIWLQWVGTDMMNIYLAYLRQAIKAEKILLVLDCAGWHRSKDLVIPTGIELIYLPPYSPELNPVERLWMWLRRHVCRNRIFDALDEIEDALSAAWIRLTAELLKSLCSCSYISCH